MKRWPCCRHTLSAFGFDDAVTPLNGTCLENRHGILSVVRDRCKSRHKRTTHLFVSCQLQMVYSIRVGQNGTRMQPECNPARTWRLDQNSQNGLSKISPQIGNQYVDEAGVTSSPSFFSWGHVELVFSLATSIASVAERNTA